VFVACTSFGGMVGFTGIVEALTNERGPSCDNGI